MNWSDDTIISQINKIAVQARDGKYCHYVINSGDLKSLIERTITSFYASSVKYVMRGFYSYDALEAVSFPVCSYIGSYAFYGCESLTSASFPVCSYIGSDAFEGCNSLTSVSFPVCSYIDKYAFEDCESLTSVSFPVCSYIGSGAFYRCKTLMSVYLTGSYICSLEHTDVFRETPIDTDNGSIFVPASLVSAYKIASNWSYYADRITAYEGD